MWSSRVRVGLNSYRGFTRMIADQTLKTKTLPLIYADRTDKPKAMLY